MGSGEVGEGDRTSGLFYIAEVQVVLLYGSETWVMYPLIGRMMGGFHQRVVCRLTGQQPRRRKYGMWVYPPLMEAMVEVGLQEMDTYNTRCQNMVAEYIATRPIMNLCLEAEQ